MMQLRAGGVQADQVYREGERSQGLDEGAELLNRYLEMMKDFATEDITGQSLTVSTASSQE